MTKIERAARKLERARDLAAEASALLLEEHKRTGGRLTGLYGACESAALVASRARTAIDWIDSIRGTDGRVAGRSAR